MSASLQTRKNRVFHKHIKLAILASEAFLHEQTHTHAHARTHAHTHNKLLPPVGMELGNNFLNVFIEFSKFSDKNICH